MTQLSVLLQSNVISSKYALIASPTFTGIPAAPTPLSSDNSTTIATTAFVKNQNFLTGNQSISVSGDATGSGSTTLNLTLASTGVSSGTYGSTSAIPQITVDSKGRVTSITNIPVVTGSTLTLSGDISGSVSGSSLVTTLATVNSNIGTFNNVTVNGKGLVTSASNIAYLTGNQTITVNGDMGGTGTTTLNIVLASTGVTPGTYGNATYIPQITVDAKGRITSVTPIQTSASASQATITLSGDVTGTGTGTVPATLATVNSNVGTYNTVTVNAKGLVTGATNQAYASIDTLDMVVSRGATTVTPIIITSNQAATSGLVSSVYTNLTGALQVTGGAAIAGNLIVGTGAVIGASSTEAGPALAQTNPSDLYIPANTYTDNVTALSGSAVHGTVASIYSTTIAATHQFVTYPKASTLYIDGAPIAGTNVTITTPYSLYVNNGASYFAGNVTLNGTTNTSSTPAQFDNTTKIATTAYVKAAGASYGNLITLSTGTILDATYVGKLIAITGTAYTTTIPAASTIGAGATFDFIAETTGVAHIAVTGADTITLSGTSSVTSLNLSNGDTATLVSNGANGWTVSGGSIRLPSGTTSILNATASYQVGSLGVGTAATGTAGEIRATNNITGYYSSDKRLKENVHTIRNALDKVDQIRGVSFEWTDDYIESHGGLDDYFVRKNDIGVIAQEIEVVLPEIVATREDGYKAVRYEMIVPLLIQAIKELKEEIAILKNK